MLATPPIVVRIFECVDARILARSCMHVVVRCLDAWMLGWSRESRRRAQNQARFPLSLVAGDYGLHRESRATSCTFEVLSSRARTSSTGLARMSRQIWITRPQVPAGRSYSLKAMPVPAVLVTLKGAKGGCFLDEDTGKEV